MPRLSELQLQLGLSYLASTATGLRALGRRSVRRVVPAGARSASRGWAGPLRPMVLGAGVLPSTLDLVARLQHLPAVQQLALAATFAAAGVSLVGWLRLPRRVPAAAGALLFGLSALVRLAGHTEGPAFALAGLTTLGLGGLFAASPVDEARSVAAAPSAAPTAAPGRLAQSA